jgi:hypothetical protein
MLFHIFMLSLKNAFNDLLVTFSVSSNENTFIKVQLPSWKMLIGNILTPKSMICQRHLQALKV